MKINLSPGDKLSILIASIALISAIFTTFIQFFYHTTELRIGSINVANSQDSLRHQLDFDILLLNTGTNPVAMTSYFTFFSANESLPNGVCYNNNVDVNNTAVYTYGCGSKLNQVIEPNVVEFIELTLAIHKTKLAEYVKKNVVEPTDESPSLNFGVHLRFVDSEGTRVSKELVIGEIQYTDDGTLSATFGHKPEELIIY